MSIVIQHRLTTRSRAIGNDIRRRQHAFASSTPKRPVRMPSGAVHQKEVVLMVE